MKYRIVTLLVFLILATAMMTPGVYASYVGQWYGRQGITAQDFAFESDYLEDTDPIPVYKVYDTEVSFQVLASDGADFHVTGSGGILTSNDDGTYTLTGTGDITVTAVCDSPYSKTLHAKFSFQSAQGGYYALTDETGYVVLDIYTGDRKYSGTVSYGADLAPDNTNPLMKDWIDKDSGGLTDLEANAHYELIFFKKTDRACTEESGKPLDSTIVLS